MKATASKAQRPYVTVVTNLASPFLLSPLRHAASLLGHGSVRVLHTRQYEKGRPWSPPADEPALDVVHVPARGPRPHADWSSRAVRTALRDAARGSRIVVGGSYFNVTFAATMFALSAASRPWWFWGERPRPWNGGAGRWLRTAYVSQCLSSASGIFSISPPDTAAYRHVLHAGQELVHLPYALDLPIVGRAPIYSSSRRPLSLLYLGRLTEGKRPSLVLGVAEALAKDLGRGCIVRFVGDGPLRTELGRQASRVADAVTVEFVGEVPRSEILTVLDAADLMVLPSAYDGWGMVVPEALARGLGVVATEEVGSAVHLREHPRLAIADSSAEGLTEAAAGLLTPGGALRETLTESDNRHLLRGLAPSVLAERLLSALNIYEST